MTTITQQLADALRDAILCVDPDQHPETFKCAREALATYDLENPHGNDATDGNRSPDGDRETP